jgi:uncharacterized membrane protein YeiH
VPHPRLTLAISILEAIATLAFAISGFIEARKNRLDSVGTFVVALATAFGGGTLRDILLERRPFYWVVHDDYVIAIFVLALFAPFVLRMLSRLSAERLLLVADAIGLGIFSISGTAIALDAEMPRFIAVMMGVITGVVGGIVRDVLCNDIPLILRDSRPMRPARSPAAGSICCSHGCSTTRCTACCSRPASFSSRGWRRSNSTCGCRTDIVAPHPMPCRAGAETNGAVHRRPRSVSFSASAHALRHAIRSSDAGSNSTAFDTSNSSDCVCPGCGFAAGCTRLTIRLPFTCANTCVSGPVGSVTSTRTSIGCSSTPRRDGRCARR